MGTNQGGVCEMCDHKHGGGCDDSKTCGGGMCGMHGHKGCWRWVLKLIILIVVLTLVFSVGMLAGAVKVLRSGYGTSVVGPTGMMGFRGMMSNGWNRMMGDEKSGSSRAFGVVSSVSGQNISYTDNGGKTGTIISSSATTIVSGNAYVGLSAIKAGQTIFAYGMQSQSGELQATWITVQ